MNLNFDLNLQLTSFRFVQRNPCAGIEQRIWSRHVSWFGFVDRIFWIHDSSSSIPPHCGPRGRLYEPSVRFHARWDGDQCGHDDRQDDPHVHHLRREFRKQQMYHDIIRPQVALWILAWNRTKWRKINHQSISQSQPQRQNTFTHEKHITTYRRHSGKLNKNMLETSDASWLTMWGFSLTNSWHKLDKFWTKGKSWTAPSPTYVNSSSWILDSKTHIR